MASLRNRIIVLALLLLTTSSVVWIHRAVYGVWRPNATLHFPLLIGEWTGKEQVIAERMYNILEADSILSRRYSKGSGSIGFSLVFYKDNQVGFHRPESCLGGLGETVFDKGTVDIAVNGWNKKISVNELHYKGHRGERILYYFYTVDDYITDSYFLVRLKMLFEQLRFRRPAVALVEVYASVDPTGIHRTKERLKDFLRHLIPELPASLTAA